MTLTAAQRLLDQLAAARRRLVETGTRNRLVHVNRNLARANVLNLVNERADSVYTLLRRDGKRLRFRATLPSEERPQDAALAAPQTAEQAAARAGDLLLETPLTPEALGKRLLRMANAARTAEEEQGVNLLYLAIGFLTWLEPGSPPTPRHAPLVLLPVELVRNVRSSTYDLRVRDEDISTNLPLQQRLLQDFGLQLPEIEEDEEWLPGGYFSRIAELIGARPGWAVEADALQLGFFSFARLLMLNDLDPANWPQQELLTNPLVGSLLGNGFGAQPPRFDDQLPLDSLDPAELIHVVDADASQTRVIEEVRRGANLVVQGPPGTGKSQTIANIIAGAVHDGKSVLFIAEKMAALRVVHDRLVAVGLRDVCFELHARSANKKTVIQELGRTLLAAQQPLTAPADPRGLREQRDELNQITADLHTPLPGRDYSPFDALAELVLLIGRNLPPPEQRVDSLARLPRAELEQLAATVQSLAELRRYSGPLAEHPFTGVQALELQPPELERLLRELDAALQAIDVARDAAAALPISLGLAASASFELAAAGRRLLALLVSAPPTAHESLSDLLRWSDQPTLVTALQTADDWQQRLQLLRRHCRDGVLELLPATLLPTLQAGSQQQLSRLSSTYQQAAATVQSWLTAPSAAGTLDNSSLGSAAAALHEPAGPREQLEAALAELLTALELSVPRDAAAVQQLQRLLEQIGAAPELAGRYVTLLWPHVDDERLVAALQAHQQWQLERLELEQTFSYAAWSTDVTDYRAATLRGAGSFFARFGKAYRQAGSMLGALLRDKLPRNATARVALFDRIVAAQQQRALLTRDEPLLQQVLQHEWLGDRTDFVRIAAIAGWLQQLRRFNRIASATVLRDVLSGPHAVAAVAAAIPQLFTAAADEDRRVTARITVVEFLQAAAQLRSAFRAAVPLLDEQLGEHWRGAATDCPALIAAIDWMLQARQLPLLRSLDDLQRALALPGLAERAARQAEFDAAVTTCLTPLQALLQISDLPLDRLGDDRVLAELRDRLIRMQREAARYGEWAALQQAVRQLQQAGLSSLAALIDRDVLSPPDAHDRLRYLIAEARWHAARLQRTTLEQTARRDRHALVRLFRAAEEQRRREIPQLVLARNHARVATDPGPALAYLRGEIARKRRHKAIRQLIDAAGTTIQRLKPIFLMSPISVAQFLPPGAVTFDLLLIDEASQVRPEEALGAVARARQIVVVGDQQQLPPTSFFERLTDNSDDEEESGEGEDGTVVPAAGLSDMESILTLCEARGLRRRMLEWHYRSRDPSLIAVSNAEFYHNQLVLPPSPLQRDGTHGMLLRRVDGVYRPRGSGGNGRGGTNRDEAAAVVAAAAEHARRTPQLSLGIATFSQVQRDLIVDLLDAARSRDRTLDTFMAEARSESLFVKNIENVQGDERDVILISVGYGPTEAGGRLSSMNFGPVNAEGGARRLNVLFSRARIRCEVFVSFDPDQIDLARTSRDGPRVLQRFLQYARDGRAATVEPAEMPPSGPFEQDLAAAISALGTYQVDSQLGSPRLRLDLAVRSADGNSRYLLAVLGDGANYRDAPWARERDRLRDAVLSGLGWRVHRIWSTDWYYRRAVELERLQRALSDAAAAVDSPPAPPATPDPSPPAAAAADTAEPAAIDAVGREALLNAALRIEAAPPPPSSGRLMQPYHRAQVRVEAAIDVHEAPPQLLNQLVTAIVEQEGPLHRSEVARRVAAAFDKERVGARISEIVETTLVQLQRAQPGTLLRNGDFWMTAAQHSAPPLRDRRLEPALLKAELLPPAEIRAVAAALSIRAANADSDAIRNIARLFGFQRSGPELTAVILQALQTR
jgi:hypothetical protein